MSINSEADIFSHFEDNFEQFDHALHDPYIIDAIAEAKQLNELMKTEATSVEDARGIVKTLDRMWGVLEDSKVMVTGNVTFLTPNGDPVTKYYEDVEMISKGFIISGDPLDTEPKVGRDLKFAFLMEIPENLKEEYELVTEGTHMMGNAEVDQVEIVANGYSFSRAKAWLTIYAARLVDEADNILFNAEGNEADVLLSLQEMEFPVYDLDEETKEVALECLSVYIAELLNLEEKLPYVAEVSGRIIIKDQMGEDIFVRISTVPRFVYVHGITILETSDIDLETYTTSNQRTEIYLRTTILNQDPEGQDLLARIPVDSLNRFESLRKITHS